MSTWAWVLLLPPEADRVAIRALMADLHAPAPPG
jgi:hypothetical protein